LGIENEFSELYQTVKDNTRVNKIPVKVRRLDTILAEHEPGVGSVDILAVDVEGWELNVLRGFSLDKYQPSVVILENLFNKRDYIDYMKSKGYGLWQRLEPNDVYVEAKLLKTKQPLWTRLKAALGL
jgi:hypothetical protein